MISSVHGLLIGNFNLSKAKTPCIQFPGLLINHLKRGSHVLLLPKVAYNNDHIKLSFLS